MACAAAWYEREQPAEKKIGGGRGCWRRVEGRWAAGGQGNRRRRREIDGEVGGGGGLTAPLFWTEEEETVGGLVCNFFKIPGV